MRCKQKSENLRLKGSFIRRFLGRRKRLSVGISMLKLLHRASTLDFLKGILESG
jgi:hypothetical protein